MASNPITSWQTERRKVEAVTYFNLLGSKITADDHCSREIKRHLLLGRKAMTNLDSIFKSKDHFANKSLYSQTYGFYSSHVWMWELYLSAEELILSNCGSGKTLDSPLDSKETKPVNPQRNQPWIFIGRADAEALIIWPADVKSQHFEKDPHAGNIEGRRGRGQLRIKWWDSITGPTDMNLSKLGKRVEDRGACHTAVCGNAESDMA